MKFIISLSLLFSYLIGQSQCPTADFTLNDPYCQNESVQVENTSTNGTSFKWDFCANEDLNSLPSVTEVSNGSAFGGNFDFSIAEDQGNYFGFVPARSSNKLFRLDFGDSIGVTPTVNDLGTFGGILDKPTGVDVFYDGTEWFGIITGFESNAIYLLEFGSSLNNAPLVTDITGTLSISSPMAVEIEKSGSNYFALVANYGTSKVSVLNFGTSISSTYTSSDIPVAGGGNLSAISIDRSCDNFYVFVLSRSSKKIFRLDFTDDLANTPSVNEISTSLGITLNDPLGMDLSLSELGYQLFVTSRNGPLYKMDMGLDITGLPTGTDLGNLNSKSSDWAVKLFKDSSSWYLMGANFTGEVYRYAFQNECGTNLCYSEEENPQDLSYDQSGTNTIFLETFDANGNSDFISKDLVVSSDVAPSIGFIIDNSICIENENSFSATGDLAEIASYQWVFGDDTLDVSSTASDTVYQFLTPGTYIVRLIVESNAGCLNQYNQEITLYPKPPEPTFIVEEMTLCTNNALTFTNTTDESGFDDVLTYQWDFDGENTSNAKDTTYVFSTEGEKLISLQSFLSGCSSPIAESFITVNVGPAVSFSWTSNCFKEDIQFVNESSGENIIGYEWNFGDGSVSTDENPVYQFAVADTFLVSLTSYNSTGCETTKAINLIVNDGNLAGINHSVAVENENIQFSGLDSTSYQDAIIDWNWDFDGLGNSSDQNPQFSFSMPGKHDILLSILTEQGCSDEVLKTIDVSESVCPTAGFNLPDEVCIGELIEIENITTNGISYHWDFCVGDELTQTPIVDQISIGNSFGSSFDIEIVKSGSNFYGFVPTRSSKELIRLDFGDSIGLNPTYNNLGNLGDIWNDPVSLSIIQTDLGWKGLAVSFNNERAYILDFGSEITNTPTVTELTDNISLTSPVSVHLEDSSGYYYGFIVNFLGGDITRINFGNIIDSDYQSSNFTISGGSQLSDIDFIRECDQWYGLVTSRGNGRVFRLNFGNSLTGIPSQDTISDGIGFVMDNPVGISIGSESEYYQVFVTSRNGPIYRLDFDGSISNIPIGLNLGNLNGITDDWSIELVQIKSNWAMIGANFTGRIYRYKFQGDCSSSLSYSEDETPENFYYNNEGVKKIKLTSLNGAGGKGTILHSLNVVNNTAPDISFTFDPSRCITNPPTFTSTNASANITSYSWDFDSDGLEDSADPNPTYQFPLEGTYTVRLSVESDEGCGNFVEQEISIYPEPPAPIFSLAKDTFCVAEPVSITNLTDDLAWDGLVEYVWSATGLTDTTADSPDLIFSTPGEKVISVYAQIPGCESLVVRDTIQVFDIPLVDFTVDPVCDGETVQFTNQSEPGTIQWDFGDGTTSSEVAPGHLYATPGTYQASLTLTNALGCSNTLIKEVDVNAIPQAAFEYDILCQNTEIAFQDMSTVDQADIVSWGWYVDDVLVSQDQTPLITFDSSGDHNLKLAVTSSDGCQVETVELVTVAAIPAVDFSTEIGCVGEATVFTDLTDPSEILTSTWLIDGESYDVTNPSHVFTAPGDYEVVLTATNNSLCTSVVNRTITIEELPVPDFTIDGSCENESIVLEDISTSGGDPIASRVWSIDGIAVGTGLDAIIEDFPAGNHVFSLTVETENGCTVTFDQDYEILSQPIASFTSSNDYGVPPFNLNFTNTSLGYSVSEWYIDDQLITTNPNPELTFESVGLKTIRLITYSTEGCSDTTEMQVNAVQPEVDLKVTSIELLDQGQSYDIAIDVTNQSNLPIESIRVNVELQNQFSIAEQVYQRINSGEKTVITLGTSVPKDDNNLGYLCVSIGSVYQVNDLNTADNEVCITIQQNINAEPPFPNPTSAETSLRYILPKGGAATIQLYDMAGQLEIDKTYENLPKGLNQFILDLGDLVSGIYLVKFHQGETIIVSKIIKL